MDKPWEKDNCAAMKAHYAVFSVPQAAALWCDVPEDHVDTIVSQATQLSESGFGQGVWCHPDVPCLEPRKRAIAEAIESGELPHGRDDANPVEKNDHVAHKRRHILGGELKKWIEKAFPNEKPSFLFDDIERNTHTAISADSYRALKAQCDTLRGQLDESKGVNEKLLEDNESIQAERDALQTLIDNSHPTQKAVVNPTMSNSPYWVKLANLATRAVNEYPLWKTRQRAVQKTGNLNEWLTKELKATSREADIIKNVLADFNKELR